ncbi:glycoside hydrolase family 97 protein [Alteromonadaceae bacterium M269]|nr:glycoside hydrolase family 97 protein [Alteromonadaceae bacterium M269]
MTQRVLGYLWLLAIGFFCASFAWAESYVTYSPDKALQLELLYENQTLSYRLLDSDRVIIQPTPISLVIDEQIYPGESRVESVERVLVDSQITPTVPTVRASIREFANETLVTFENQSALRVRVYNDGAAFRWETDLGDKSAIAHSEELSFNFSNNYQLYWPTPNGDGFFSHQESLFERKAASSVSAETRQASGPLLVDLAYGKYLLISDVNVEQYPGLWFRGSGSSTINAVFPPYPKKTKLVRDRDLRVVESENFLAKTTGKRAYPWRAFVLTDAKGLINSNMLYTLADPSRLENTDWIKPGKVAWDWFNDWNLTDVDFEAGINQATYKNYIDFAANHQLDYIILDEGWSVPEPENLLKVVPEIDMPELIEYAHNKGIGVVLWMTSVALERNFEQAFQQFSQWQVDGLKVDFMQRDDQVMMDFCVEVARKAAEHQMLVDFHGGSKPTGLQRTYPNVLTHESVMGLEQTKWSRNANPDMALLLPFIRMVAGPMDYTPGAMDNFHQENFRQSYENPASLGTRAHQLAIYVTYLSPLQMLADTPSKYRREPESMAFLSDVPTTWDETVVLHAEVGEALSVARRSGNKWYVSAMTNWSPRELKLPMDFLGKGRYRLKYWEDGVNVAENASSFKQGQAIVSDGADIRINLASGGGYVAVIEAL